MILSRTQIQQPRMTKYLRNNIKSEVFQKIIIMKKPYNLRKRFKAFYCYISQNEKAIFYSIFYSFL